MPKTADEPAARVAALWAESHRHAELEARANATLERIARDLPTAQVTLDLAGVSAEAGAKAAAQDAVRKLELEKSNAESVIRGVTIRRPILAQEINQAEATIARARAKEIAPVAKAGELVTESLTDAFAELAELVTAGIRPSVEASPRDDHRGLIEAADIPALARWIWVQCAQSGIDLAQAQHRPGAGTDPAVTVTNFRAVLETLK